MNPAAYCAERALAAGGDAALIVRFARPERRAALTALAALRAELEHLVEQRHDPAIARAKLAWWRTELAGLAAGQAQHPACQALLECGADRRRCAEALLAFSDALETELAGQSALDPARWRAFVLGRGGWHLALATDPAADAGALATAAAALAELELLAGLGRRLGAARPAHDLGWGVPAAAFAARAPEAQAAVRARAIAASEALARPLPGAALAIAQALGRRRARRLAVEPLRAWRGETAASVGALFTAWRAALQHPTPTEGSP